MAYSNIPDIKMNFQSYFPGQIRLLLLLKPEGVLQRALEVGYRGVTENCSFKVSFLSIWDTR